MPPTEKAEHKFDPTKLKAGREQLEAELQRRIIAKLDSGEAVLMPPRILGAPEPERPRPIPKDAKGREIYGGTRTKEGGIDFIDAIITGVPRTGLGP
jgi:hypothetical protein